MKVFIVIRANNSFPNGTIVRMLDEGFSKMNFDAKGKYIDTDMLTVAHAAVQPFIIPFMMDGQFAYENGKAHHTGHESGDYRAALNEVVFSPLGDDEDWEEFL